MMLNDIYLINVVAIVLPCLALLMLLSKNIITSILLQTMFSLGSALLYVLLAAPDVALTETALNACLATLIFLIFARVFNRQDKVPLRTKVAFLVIIAVSLTAIYYAIPEFLPFGDQKNNIHHHVVPYYISNITNDIGIPNLVAGILASYRGFDTLGETFVIFTAVIAVFTILTQSGLTKALGKAKATNSENMLTKKTTHLLLPIILLFGFYIYFYGEISPGGGFQAGAIIASIHIAYLIFVSDEPKDKLKSLLLKLAAFGVFIYAATGLTGIFGSFNYLDYDSLNNPLIGGQKLGIMLIELGVTFTVWAALTLIAFSILEFVENSAKKSK